MTMIAVLGQIDLHEEDADAAEVLMRIVMNESIHEQGCIRYAYSRDLSHPNRFHLSELWENEQLLSAHLHAPHTAAYRAEISKLRVVARNVKKHDVTNVRDL